MKKILKIIVVIILILNVLVLTSCRSGWSCKKRYAETSNEVKKTMIHINKSDEGFFQAMIFDPTNNIWNELLTFDLNSLVLQANIIYDIDLREYLN